MYNPFEYIILDNELKNKVIDFENSNKDRVRILADKCINKGFRILHRTDDLTKLAVVLECTRLTKEKYDKIGINNQIFADTMSDINIWCRNNGNKGLKNTEWIKNHINCELFRIGRLQYQMFTCRSKSINYKNLPFESGDKMIYIHIPQGERLIYDECISSINDAISFFAEYFPDYYYRYFFCESWLLYEDNYLFMNPMSNILQFSSLFKIIKSSADDSQAIERIFGKKELFKKNYAEKTTLQKSAKAFMLEGGKLGIGIGFIDKSDFE
ncbi:MAG: acyltransferase domain-containing protein [Acetobacter sp.]|nr:acyltransferase domain-containing protein [Bacteroides sp.]MCM1341428.1 acyltransferase domain-containing protein [Acetobacter sp.]MCM1433382.1 acyltransferase domain-containing protein [Clostridiales bacterium]